MMYDGAAVRAKLTALRDAMMVAKDRTELDPFDDAVFTAVHYMLDLSETQSAVIESLSRSTRKMGRKLR